MRGTMLQNARAATRLPAQDLDRARRFYAEKLGLEPVDVPGLRTVDGIADIGATTRARTPVPSAAGGSATARGTCSGSVSRCA